MTLINGDRIITAQLYDDEYEEFIEKQMSIIDFVNAYSNEGVITADDVLDKIKRDVFNACSDNYHIPVHKLDCDEIFGIIDKYREGSEE